MNKLRILLILVSLLVFEFGFGQVTTDSVKEQRPKVGLVFSGGGAKGYAYIGLLKVLHEVNMPIDFIGGSSIGAIVGAMYAIGYHPDTIEHIVRSQDWDVIVSNYLERKYSAFEEKQFREKSIFSVSIDSNKISFGSSLSESLNVDLMLNRIFSPAYHISDFNELDIPFLCIGTDLITGEGIVLNSGNLPRAIRASMSIPGYFPPVYYNGHYLIDGGVVNNFPAEQVKDLGADIIIGGDVQSKKVTDINDLNSIPKILDHIISYQRVDANKKGRALTDVYIRFEMDYGMMDFTEYDSIINLGYRIANEHYDELKDLADSLNGLEPPTKRLLAATPFEEVIVDEIIIEGNEKLNKKIVKGYFEEQKKKKKVLTITDIEESIRFLSGTKSFKDINYELYHKDNQDILKLTFSKAGQGELSAGMNYNNDYQANLMINFAFRNLWNTRAKVFTDVVLGQSPRFYGLFIVNNGIKPGFGFDLDFYRFQLSTFQDGEKQNNWDFRSFGSSAYIPITFENSMEFKLGAKYEYFKFDQDIPSGNDSIYDEEFRHFGQLFMSIDVDRRDKAFFSKKGGRLVAKVKYAVPLAEMYTDDASNNFYASLTFEQNLKLFNRMIFKPSGFAGYAYQSKLNILTYQFGVGGQSSFNYLDGIASFTGLRFVEKFGNYSAVVRTHFQYNTYKKTYLTLMVDAGFNEYNWDAIDADAFLLGWGAKFSYDSFIGPVSFSLMGSNAVKGVSYFINIGFPIK